MVPAVSELEPEATHRLVAHVHLPSWGLADAEAAPDVFGQDALGDELCEGFGELVSAKVRRQREVPGTRSNGCAMSAWSL